MCWFAWSPKPHATRELSFHPGPTTSPPYFWLTLVQTLPNAAYLVYFMRLSASHLPSFFLLCSALSSSIPAKHFYRPPTKVHFGYSSLFPLTHETQSDQTTSQQLVMTSEEINNRCSSHLLFLKLNHGIFLRLLLFLLLLPLATAQSNNSPSSQSPPPSAFGFGQNFNPPMAILMVVLVGVFFLLGFFSVYIRQCSRNRDGFNPSAASIIGGAGRSRRTSPGLDPAIIDTFPTFQYSTVKGLKIGKGSLECAVCLNEFEDSETLRLIPKCSHVFHPDCIGEWLASHTTCPVCRANLVPKPGDSPVNLVYNFEPENDSVGSDQQANTDEQTIQQVSIQAADANDQIREEAVTPTQHQDVNLLNPANQNRAPRSWSIGWSRLFPRSHSTGHSLVQPGENLDRFTLRLPKEVRSQLMNNHLNRTASLVVFPRVSSSRRGYRSKSVGVQRSTNLGRFDEVGQPDRWGFTIIPPFISRTGSLGSSRSQERVNSTTTAHPLKSLSRSIRSPFDRFFLGLDKSNNENDGEPSTERLRPDSQV